MNEFIANISLERKTSNENNYVNWAYYKNYGFESFMNEFIIIHKNFLNSDHLPIKSSKRREYSAEDFQCESPKTNFFHVLISNIDAMFKSFKNEYTVIFFQVWTFRMTTVHKQYSSDVQRIYKLWRQIVHERLLTNFLLSWFTKVFNFI